MRVRFAGSTPARPSFSKTKERLDARIHSKEKSVVDLYKNITSLKTYNHCKTQ